MHRILLISLVPAFLGCLGLFSGNPDRFYCESYLDCIAETEPTLLAQTEATYGEDGACWGNGSDEECERACQSGLDAMALLHPSEPTCDAGLIEDSDAEVIFQPLSGEYALTYSPPTDPRCLYELYSTEPWYVDIHPGSMEIENDIYAYGFQCTLSYTLGFSCPEAFADWFIDSRTYVEFRDTFEGDWTSSSTFEGIVRVDIRCDGDCEFHNLEGRCTTEFPFSAVRR
ncbi:MAG: hypothetical protein EA397_19670 [Deltaproteobacteria bacterium]|nr:MAG: hypothetical protein EA397_19670 [Deltaproteobacteria bacterium]